MRTNYLNVESDIWSKTKNILIVFSLTITTAIQLFHFKDLFFHEGTFRTFRKMSRVMLYYEQDNQSFVFVLECHHDSAGQRQKRSHVIWKGTEMQRKRALP